MGYSADPPGCASTHALGHGRLVGPEGQAEAAFPRGWVLETMAICG
jgi:hypothetical protein